MCMCARARVCVRIRTHHVSCMYDPAEVDSRISCAGRVVAFPSFVSRVLLLRCIWGGGGDEVAMCCGS